MNVSVTTGGGALPTLTRASAVPTTPAASRASTRSTQSPEIAVLSVSIRTNGAATSGPGSKVTRRAASIARPSGADRLRRNWTPRTRGRSEGDRTAELRDRLAEERLTCAAVIDGDVGAYGHERLSGARCHVDGDAGGPLRTDISSVTTSVTS